MNIPQRMCVSCRKRHDKTDLIRISKLNDQAVVDNNKEHAGRGIYICKNIKCLELLKKNKATERMLKVSLDDDFHHKLKLIIEEKNFD